MDGSLSFVQRTYMQRPVCHHRSESRCTPADGIEGASNSSLLVWGMSEGHCVTEMNPVIQRALGAAGAIVVGAAVNIGTSLVTDHQDLAWWVSGIVVLLFGAFIQWWLPLSADDRSVTDAAPSVMDASGNVVGGTLRQESDHDTSLAATDNEVGGDLHQSHNGDGGMRASGNRIKGGLTQKEFTRKDD